MAGRGVEELGYLGKEHLVQEGYTVPRALMVKVDREGQMVLLKYLVVLRGQMEGCMAVELAEEDLEVVVPAALGLLVQSA